MSERETKDQLTDHSYDGIREYDNPTPGWWTWLFIVTIVFSAVYFFIAVLSGGQLSAVSSYDQSVVEELKKSGGKLTADAPTLLRLMKDADTLKVGASIFVRCAQCHGPEGQGLTGPNLTDDVYVNVQKITDIYDVVARGRKNGLMPAWQNQLSPNEMVQVSAYVASMRGKNKTGGRGPEGQAIGPWE